jgi:hypothetical protein
MKKSKFSEEQIAFGLREVEGGRPVADVCCQDRWSESRNHRCKMSPFLRRSCPLT